MKILFYLAVGIAIIIAFKVFASPLKLIFKLLINTLLGMLLLLLFNFLGKYIGVTLGINFVNAFVIALFGPAGLVLLLLVQWLVRL